MHPVLIGMRLVKQFSIIFSKLRSRDEFCQICLQTRIPSCWGALVILLDLKLTFISEIPWALRALATWGEKLAWGAHGVSAEHRQLLAQSAHLNTAVLTLSFNSEVLVRVTSGNSTVFQFSSCCSVAVTQLAYGGPIEVAVGKSHFKSHWNDW